MWLIRVIVMYHLSYRSLQWQEFHVASIDPGMDKYFSLFQWTFLKAVIPKNRPPLLWGANRRWHWDLSLSRQEIGQKLGKTKSHTETKGLHLKLTKFHVFRVLSLFRASCWSSHGFVYDKPISGLCINWYNRLLAGKTVDFTGFAPVFEHDGWVPASSENNETPSCFRSDRSCQNVLPPAP